MSAEDIETQDPELEAAREKAARVAFESIPASARQILAEVIAAASQPGRSPLCWCGDSAADHAPGGGACWLCQCVDFEWPSPANASREKPARIPGRTSRAPEADRSAPAEPMPAAVEAQIEVIIRNRKIRLRALEQSLANARRAVWDAEAALRLARYGEPKPEQVERCPNCGEINVEGEHVEWFRFCDQTCADAYERRERRERGEPVDDDDQ